MSSAPSPEPEPTLLERIERGLRGERLVNECFGPPMADPSGEREIAWLEAHRITPKPGLETPSQSLAALRDGSKS